MYASGTNSKARDLLCDINYPGHRQTPIITDVQIQYLSPMFRAVRLFAKGALLSGEVWQTWEPLRKEAPYCPVLQGDNSSICRFRNNLSGRSPYVC